MKTKVSRDAPQANGRTGRRRFIKRIVAGAGLGALSSQSAMGEDSSTQPRRADNTGGDVTTQADVLVVGGGTAGTIAAIQSARAGAKTILVECGSQLGGTATTGGVSYPGLFHAHGKQVIKGIGWELVEECVLMNSDVMQDFTIPYGTNHSRHHVIINPYLYAILAEEKCLNDGVRLRYYETPVKAAFEDHRWVVDVVGKGTRASIRCKQLIDCTGNALVTAMAGYKVVRSKECQPGTMMFKLTGYDPRKLDTKLLNSEYNKALSDGRFQKEEFFGHLERTLKTGHYTNKAATFVNHIHGADSTSSETHSAANLKGRNALLKMLRFLRTLPGLEKTSIYSMCQETSIRETYRIDSLHEVTVDEYLTGSRYEDAVCNSFYPIDLHDKAGVDPKQLKDGIVPAVPLRALVPKQSTNFLVAGRCVGSDQLANSALRVQASCMAMGQAAGATAALAAAQNTTPLRVSMKDIRDTLQNHDAILPAD